MDKKTFEAMINSISDEDKAAFKKEHENLDKAADIKRHWREMLVGAVDIADKLEDRIMLEHVLPSLLKTLEPDTKSTPNLELTKYGVAMLLMAGKFFALGAFPRSLLSMRAVFSVVLAAYDHWLAFAEKAKRDMGL